MVQIKKIDNISELDDLKANFVAQATAPLDGMWLVGFVPFAKHFGFYAEQQLIGYCCINDEGYLLQFYIVPEHFNQSSELFSLLLEENSLSVEIIGAFVSTAEPQYLSMCLEHFSTFKVNALMYQLQKPEADNKNSDIELIALELEQLEEVVSFANQNIGAPESWLRGYYTNLINRKELFGYWQDEQLVAAGESRGYDNFQLGLADIGVIVAKSQRCKGQASKVLRQLVSITKKRHLEPICSTEISNVAAQKAICRAGFVAANRIIQFNV